jgi:glycosyltransferase involved in cell wall biosynthesis
MDDNIDAGEMRRPIGPRPDIPDRTQLDAGDRLCRAARGAEDGVAAPDQLIAQGPADKAGGAGHQNACQARLPLPRPRPDCASDVWANALKRAWSLGKADGPPSILGSDWRGVTISESILPAVSPPPGDGDAGRRPKLLFLVTEDWYFCSHRLPVARAARDAGFEIVVATRVRSHGPQIRDEGFALRPIAWRRRGDGLVGAVRAVAAIARLYRAERPDILHHVALKPVLFGGLARALAFRGAAEAPASIDAVMGLGSGFSATAIAARLRRPPLGIALRLAAASGRGRIVVQNPEDGATLAALGIDPQRIALIRGSGVDIRYFAPLPMPHGDTVRVALVSRMLRDKGVLDAVAAIRRLRARGLAVELVLAGPTDPDNPGSLSAAALATLAAEPGIAWLGAVADVREVWRQAAIAVLPSTYGEGIPKALLEAAACARPIVASDVPGCREAVRSAVSGVLVPPHDIDALAEAIAALVADPAGREAMGHAGRALIASRFAEEIVAGETLALYRAVLAERAMPR